MKVELGHRQIITNPSEGDYEYAEVEVIAYSPSKTMAKFKTDAGVLFWELIERISIKEELLEFMIASVLCTFILRF